MKSVWRCRFQGRQVGAIGIMHHCKVHVVAEDEEAARLGCYRTHEHLMHFTAEVVREPTLNQVLEGLGLTARPSGEHGKKEILERRDDYVLFRGRAHEVWDWLKLIERFP